MWHEWFPRDSVVQDIVTYAYRLGGYDFLAVLECENGRYDTKAVGDSGNSFGLCQMNRRFHKDIPQEYYDWVWQVQVEYCYQKWKNHTVFYWPQRMIKGQKCYNYIRNRFTYIE